MDKVPEIVLNSGARMPALGMGTATYPIPPPEVVESAVLHAIELGYRHFDTASVYESELPLGHAVALALQRGLIASRDELFITSKLWCTDMHPNLVLPALRGTLKALEMEYVDLYLIHFPGRLQGEKCMVVNSKEVMMMSVDLRGVWEAMEECNRMGLAKSIGVSNYTTKKLAELLDYAQILPAVNQVEMHPLWQQKKLRKLCSERGIHVCAYSPLGAIGAVWGTNAVLEAEEVKRIAQSKGKTPAQVCLRWAFEQGVVLLPKSFNKERLQENMEIFDWQLNEENLKELSILPQKRLILVPMFLSPNGPYKSHADIWDGEV